MNKNAQNGQALLLVVLALAVGLTVAVLASQRTLTSVLRFTVSDSSTKSSLVAQSALENILTKTQVELASLATTCPAASIFSDPNSLPANPPAGCVYNTFGNTKYRAVLGVDTYPASVNEPLYLEIDKNSVAEINLQGYGTVTLSVCFIGYDENNLPAHSGLFYNVYQDINKVYNKYQKYIPCKSGSSGCVVTDSYSEYFLDGGVGAASLGTDGSTCFLPIGIDSNAVALRIMSIHNKSRVKITPPPGYQLPAQGYKITAVGEQVGGDPLRNPRKKISIELSNPYMPLGFDNAITSLTGTISP